MSQGACQFAGCGRPPVAKGLCSGHYNQQRKGQALRELKVTGSPDGRRWSEHECAVHNCRQPAHCRGYCSVHYTAWKNHGDPLVVKARSRSDTPPTHKTCSRCAQRKALDDFPLRPGAIDGHRGVCIQCRRDATPRKTNRRKGVITACVFPGCTEPARAQGRCPVHRAQWERTGTMWAVGNSPFPNANRLQDEHALQQMLDAGFHPTVPYPGSTRPWPGVCLRCGQPGKPRLHHLRTRAGDPCNYCAGKVIAEEIRWGTMVARGFTPLEPYPGAQRKWRSRHTCGAEVAITWHHATGNITPWCVHCMQLGGYRPTRTGWFYVVTDGQIIKAGITNRPQRRLADHAQQRLTQVLHLVECDDGHVPLALEEQWRVYVRNAGAYRLVREVLPDGYTEAVLWHSEAVAFLDHLCRTAQR